MSELQVVYKAGDFRIEIGSTHPQLDAFLAEKGAERWVLLTAENPHSEEFPFYINKQRTGVLRDELADTDWLVLEATGESNQEDSPTENCFLIIGITLQEAAEVAFRYHQDALVTGVPNGFAQIVGL